MWWTTGLVLVPLFVGAAPTGTNEEAAGRQAVVESTKASRDQMDGVLSWIASEIERRLGHLAHFRDFNPAKAVQLTSIEYRHRVRWVRNPNYEQQSKNKPRAPVPERVPTFPFEDSILLELTVVDPESQYALQRQWSGAIRIYGWPVEFRLQGRPGEDLDEIRQVLVELLEAVDAAPID